MYWSGQLAHRSAATNTIHAMRTGRGSLALAIRYLGPIVLLPSRYAGVFHISCMTPHITNLGNESITIDQTHFSQDFESSEEVPKISEKNY